MDKIRLSQTKERMQQVRSRIDEMANEEKGLLQEREADTQRSTQRSILIIVIGTAFGIIFISLLSLIVGQDISYCIAMLTKSAANITRGRFDALTILRSKDEFGELSSAIGYMADSLQAALDSTTLERANRLSLESRLQGCQNLLQQASLRADELLSSARTAICDLDNHPAGIERLLNRVRDAQETSNQLEALARTVDSDARLGFDSLEGAKKIAVEIHTLSDRADDSKSAATVAMSQLGDRMAEVKELTENMGRTAAELNLVALAQAMEAARLGNDAKPFCSLIDEIKTIAERIRTETLKLKEQTAKIENTVTSSTFTGQALGSTLGSLAKLSRALAEELNRYAEVAADSKTRCASLAEISSSHSANLPLAQRAQDELLSCLSRQNTYLHQTAERAAELRQLSIRALDDTDYNQQHQSLQNIASATESTV